MRFVLQARCAVLLLTTALLSQRFADVGPKTGATSALAKAADFRTALGEVDHDPVDCIYVDFEKAFALIDAAVQKGDDEVKEAWPKVRDASGIAAMKRWISTGAFAGKSWSAQSFRQLAGEPKGLLSICPD